MVLLLITFYFLGALLSDLQLLSGNARHNFEINLPAISTIIVAQCIVLLGLIAILLEHFLTMAIFAVIVGITGVICLLMGMSSEIPIGLFLHCFMISGMSTFLAAIVKPFEQAVVPADTAHLI